MLVVFRTDASIQIGTGHVMRCLTLAGTLQTQGATCHFICREHAGNLIELLEGRGFTTHRLTQEEGNIDIAVDPGAEPELAHAHWLGASWREDSESCQPILAELSPDWLVIDHYALDQRWERSVLDSITGSRSQLLVIDDLADRPHRADVLLDQNFGRAPSDYADLMPAGCDIRIGPAHALLRPEFARLRPRALARREALKRPETLLITLGGIDKDNVTGVVLDALARAPDVRGCGLPWLWELAPHISGPFGRKAASYAHSHRGRRRRPGHGATHDDGRSLHRGRGIDRLGTLRVGFADAAVGAGRQSGWSSQSYGSAGAVAGAAQPRYAGFRHGAGGGAEGAICGRCIPRHRPCRRRPHRRFRRGAASPNFARKIDPCVLTFCVPIPSIRWYPLCATGLLIALESTMCI